MKKIYIDKTFEGTDNVMRLNNLVEECINPMFESFNNVRLVNVLETTLNGHVNKEYIYEINGGTNLYLALLLNPSYPYSVGYSCGFYTRFVSSSTPSYGTILDLENNGWSRYGDRIATTNGKYRTEMYFITDEDNNLKVFWENNIAGDYRYPMFTIFTKTASGKDGAIVLTNGSDNLRFFYLNEASHMVYYIQRQQDRYNSDSSVIKLNYVVVQKSINDDSAFIIDVIDEDFVFIYNIGLYAYLLNVDQPFSRKLIKVDNQYYRQLHSFMWYADPLGDEEPILYVDET